MVSENQSFDNNNKNSSSRQDNINIGKFKNSRNLRLFYEYIPIDCLVCHKTKESQLEMRCSFCNKDGIMTEYGKFMAKEFQNTLLASGILNERMFF